MKKLTIMPINAAPISAQNRGRISLKIKVKDKKSRPVPSKEVAANLDIERPNSLASDGDLGIFMS